MAVIVFLDVRVLIVPVTVRVVEFVMGNIGVGLLSSAVIPGLIGHDGGISRLSMAGAGDIELHLSREIEPLVRKAART